MHRAGSPLPAAMSSTDVIAALGTGKSDVGRPASMLHGFGVTGVAIDVVVVLNPAHWFCEFPTTQLGPCLRVGAGELLTQFRFPATLTRLISEAALEALFAIWALPPMLPSHATHGPALPLHSKLALMATSGPTKPFGAEPLHEWMRPFPSTSTLPLRRAESQLAASMLPPIVDGAV